MPATPAVASDPEISGICASAEHFMVLGKSARADHGPQASC